MVFLEIPSAALYPHANFRLWLIGQRYIRQQVITLLPINASVFLK